MKAEALDFIQVDYALDNRKADERILPLAADRGMAVMINLPFGRGRLFNAVQGKKLPSWASEFDCVSWAQFFLKYIVSHPAVTCAVPGTAKVFPAAAPDRSATLGPTSPAKTASEKLMLAGRSLCTAGGSVTGRVST